MIVIGADTHKRTHALAAIDADTGQGQLDRLRWARELGQDIVWAIEDCRDLSHHLEQSLIAAGERVVLVGGEAHGTSRRGEREPGQVRPDRRQSHCLRRAQGGVLDTPPASLCKHDLGLVPSP
jgi:transposase